MAFPQCIWLLLVGKCDFLGAALGSEVTAPSTSQKSDSLIGIRRDAVAGERQIMHDAGQEAFRIFRKKIEILIGLCSLWFSKGEIVLVKV